MDKPAYHKYEAYERSPKHEGYTERDYDAMLARWRVYGLAVAVLVVVAVAVGMVLL